MRVISRTSRLRLLREMALAGLTDRELAGRLGLSPSYVRRELRALRRAGLAVRTMPWARHYLSSAVAARVVGERVELRFETSDDLEVVVAWPGERGAR